MGKSNYISSPEIQKLLNNKFCELIEISSKFNLKTWVIINKYDLNIDMANQIESYCNSFNIKVSGKIPFDAQIVEAMVNCKSITEWRLKSETFIILKQVFAKIITNTIEDCSW